jgi:hypothetical protein
MDCCGIPGESGLMVVNMKLMTVPSAFAQAQVEGADIAKAAPIFTTRSGIKPIPFD